MSGQRKNICIVLIRKTNNVQAKKKTCKVIPPLPTLQIVNEASKTISKVPENKMMKQKNNELEENSTPTRKSSLYDLNKHVSMTSSSDQSDILCSGK